MIAVSACLMGDHCRYNGQSATCHQLINLLSERECWLFCPEQFGRLPTPRSPAEIIGGDGRDVLLRKAKVVDAVGQDVTEAFLLGATVTLSAIKELGIKAVVLKENSPSCGVEVIYDGSFSDQKMPGCGVTTAMILKTDVRVFTEKHMGVFQQWLKYQGKDDCR